MEADGSGPLSEATVAPTIATERCSGCGRCVAACPQHLFTLEATGFRKHAVLLATERCTACGRCIAACPVAALHT